MSKYNVGDKVRIVSKRGDCWNMRGLMDHWCNKVMTILEVDGGLYRMVEDQHENGGSGWLWGNDDIVELVKDKRDEKIVIIHDGKTTTATLYKADGSKEKATARCAPEDTFDFNVGAKLAMERLMEKVEPNVKQLNVKFKTGDYARIVDRKNGHEFEIGTIVRLEKFETDYKAHADGDYWWVLDDELEAYTPPKYYNGKVVCVERGFKESCPIPEFTIGKVYSIVDGVITGNTGWKSNEYTTLEKLCIGMGWKFVPLVE